MNRRSPALAATLVGLTLATAPAHAMIPVIDIASLTQLIQQVLSWQQQLEGMQQQLAQLRSTYGAMTGPRGMQGLLPVPLPARNYLPTDWAAINAVTNGVAAGYADLARVAATQKLANAVLKPDELAHLPADLQLQLVAERDAVAGGQALTRAAYGRSSDRFATLQTLIDHIGLATDAKAIAELQGRIAAEQAMVANEGLKLVALAQVAQADSAARALARQETALANHGRFEQRLQPVPPAP